MLTDHMATVTRASRAVFGTRHPLFDDGVQEGAVAVWRALDKDPHMSEALAYTIAKRRCLSLLETGHQTGHQRTVTWANHAQEVSSDIMFHDADEGPNPIPGAEDRAAVRIALQQVSADARAYAYHRFWLDEGEQELSRSTGKAKVTNRLHWRTKFKPEIEAALKGIADDVFA